MIASLENFESLCTPPNIDLRPVALVFRLVLRRPFRSRQTLNRPALIPSFLSGPLFGPGDMTCAGSALISLVVSSFESLVLRTQAVFHNYHLFNATLEPCHKPLVKMTCFVSLFQERYKWVP